MAPCLLHLIGAKVLAIGDGSTFVLFFWGDAFQLTSEWSIAASAINIVSRQARIQLEDVSDIVESRVSVLAVIYHLERQPSSVSNCQPGNIGHRT